MAEYIERAKIFSVWRSIPAPASVASLAAAISQTPAADVVPVVHGRWEPDDNYFDEDTWYCSACSEPFVLIEGTLISNSMNYCPNCGAKMDGEEQDDE